MDRPTQMPASFNSLAGLSEEERVNKLKEIAISLVDQTLTPDNPDIVNHAFLTIRFIVNSELGLGRLLPNDLTIFLEFLYDAINKHTRTGGDWSFDETESIKTLLREEKYTSKSIFDD